MVCFARPTHDLRDQIRQVDLLIQLLRYLLRISHEIILISYGKKVVFFSIKNTLQIQLFKTMSSHVDIHLKSGRKLRTIIFLSDWLKITILYCSQKQKEEKSYESSTDQLTFKIL